MIRPCLYRAPLIAAAIALAAPFAAAQTQEPAQPAQPLDERTLELLHSYGMRFGRPLSPTEQFVRMLEEDIRDGFARTDPEVRTFSKSAPELEGSEVRKGALSPDEFEFTPAGEENEPIRLARSSILTLDPSERSTETNLENPAEFASPFYQSEAERSVTTDLDLRLGSELSPDTQSYPWDAPPTQGHSLPQLSPEADPILRLEFGTQ